MPPRRDRVKPTSYPVIIFHTIRSVQLVSAIVVAAIISYFLWELVHDHYRLPWTFILLLAVSLLTILTLITTTVLHCVFGLHPLLNTSVNGILLALWTVSFALLLWWTSGTLAHICTRADWDSETGVSICRAYKALFSFSLFGFVSTLVALLLDIHVQRKSTRRGKFMTLQNTDHKDLPLESSPNSFAMGTTGREGYAVPDEQFAYGDADTSYHGAAHQTSR